MFRGSMVHEIWILLAVIAAFVQVFLARKKSKHYIAMILPLCFLAFAVYAWVHLFKVGIGVSVLLMYMIPPVFLMSLFELIYWKRQWEEKERKEEGEVI